MQHEACSHEEVMLDWAIAEVLSDGAWENWYRPYGLSDDLRERVRSSKAADLSAPDRSSLLRAVCYVRHPLIAAAGITMAATFWKAATRASELAQFAIIPTFASRYGSIPFGEFAAKIRTDPLDTEANFRAQTLEMLGIKEAGGAFIGRPIAITAPILPKPVLIEGYKRSMVALWSGAESVELFFCEPSTGAKR